MQKIPQRCDTDEAVPSACCWWGWVDNGDQRAWRTVAPCPTHRPVLHERWLLGMYLPQVGTTLERAAA